MQIKTTLRFYHIPFRLAKIKSQAIAEPDKNVEKEGLYFCCDRKLVHPLWKSVWRLLRTVYILLPEEPDILHLGIYPEDSPTCHKDTCSTMFREASLKIARSLK